jgi:hypothetical protein
MRSTPWQRTRAARRCWTSNDLSLGIVRAQQAQSSYYILGYYSTNANRDGKLRKVKVTVKDRNADLSYRESYYADKEFTKYSSTEKERHLEEALLLGNPITDLTIVMEMNYFRLNNAEYFIPLAVKIPGSELVLAQKEGAEKTVIDFLWEIKGRIRRHCHETCEIRLRSS